MDRLYALWGVQTSNKSTARVEELDAEWSPKLSSFYTELFLDPGLFARYKAVYDKRHDSGLDAQQVRRSEEHTSELQSLMRISYAVFCLKKKKTQISTNNNKQNNNIQ